jgi:hypothetical protein
MKFTTPEECAACFGPFIANLKSTGIPISVFETHLKDVTTITKLMSLYKQNRTPFEQHIASILPIPANPKRLGSINSSDFLEYNTRLNEAWASMSIELTTALTTAQVDSVEKERIIEFFESLKFPLRYMA